VLYSSSHDLEFLNGKRAHNAFVGTVDDSGMFANSQHYSNGSLFISVMFYCRFVIGRQKYLLVWYFMSVQMEAGLIKEIGAQGESGLMKIFNGGSRS